MARGNLSPLRPLKFRRQAADMVNYAVYNRTQGSWQQLRLLWSC